MEADESILGYLSTGVDAVVFCDRLSDYVAAEGFDGIPISVRVSANAPELAAGSSGGDCAAS